MNRRWRAALAVAASAAVCAGPALAQTAAGDPQPAGVVFLPRAALLLSAEHLSGDDPRFVWDARFGGDIDVIDFGRGRGTFLAVYQVVLGEELRIFDPNQGNYTLAGSLSVRAGGLELSGVFHHVSRHLSDRDKRMPVDWNMLGGRIQAAHVRGRWSTGLRADVRGVVQKSFVDYRWEIDAGARTAYQVAPNVAVVASGGLTLIGVDGSRTRGTQTGARGESGLRISGRAGAAELFVAMERRIDPYQLEFGTATWVLTGFRLVSR